MNHQDWDNIVIRSKTKPDKDQTKAPKSKEVKLEEKIAEGMLSHKKMDISFGRDLQKKRLSQNMTQKDLAQKMNCPCKMITDIESGRAPHNAQLMNKINRLFK